MFEAKPVNGERKNSSDRGSKFFCRRCLGQLGRRTYNIHKLTCKQTQKAIKTDYHVQQGKRYWWRNMKEKAPQLCAEFLRVTGWTKEQVEEYINYAAFEHSKRRNCFKA